MLPQISSWLDRRRGLRNQRVGNAGRAGILTGFFASASSANWIARYTFTQTGRPVENHVRASVRFADGLIAEHRDEFDFHRWSRQALGAPGLLLGWTPLLRASVRRRARAGLDEFLAGAGRGL